MNPLTDSISVTDQAADIAAVSPLPPVLSAVLLSASPFDAAALASSVTVLVSAHAFHDSPLSGDFASVEALDPTHTAPKVSPPEAPQLFRVLWRRRNGVGVADTLHVIDSVSAVSLVEAQRQIENRHVELVGDVAAVTEDDLPNVLAQASARFQQAAQREVFEAELNRRDAHHAQQQADAAARRQQQQQASDDRTDFEKGVAAVRLEREQAKAA